MEVTTEEKLKDRKLELERSENVNYIESESLNLKVGENMEFAIMDVMAQQRLRTRFAKIKKDLGISFKTDLRANTVVVTRLA